MKRHHIDESLWLAEDDDGEIRLLENTGDSIRALSLPEYALQLAQEVMRLRAVIDLAGELERLGPGRGTDVNGATIWRNRGRYGYEISPNRETREGSPVGTASDAARLVHGVRTSLRSKLETSLETP